MFPKRYDCYNNSRLSVSSDLQMLIHAHMHDSADS